MWEPRRLTTLWAFLAWYKDSFNVWITVNYNAMDVYSIYSIVRQCGIRNWYDLKCDLCISETYLWLCITKINMISIIATAHEVFQHWRGTVLIKFRYLFWAVSSYRNDLNLARLILISKMNYKIVLWNLLQLPSGLLQNFSSFIIFTEYLADAFLRLKTLAKTYFAVSVYVSSGMVPLSVVLL
jgi:hypothetical protein